MPASPLRTSPVGARRRGTSLCADGARRATSCARPVCRVPDASNDCMRWFGSLIAFVALAANTTANAAIDAAPLQAFTTSTTGTGDLHSWAEVAGTGLSGLAAGDGICQARAAAARLANPEQYVVWLSD